VLKFAHPNQYFVENKLPVKCVGLQVGDTVYCQVTKIKEEEAFVSIVQVNSNTVNKPIEASIRKEHVREKLVDQVVMSDSFKPGDFIKAKIISLGDSLRNLYLTTAG
jgi:exosome complex component CSL4